MASVYQQCIFPPSTPPKGRIAVVTDAELDVVDALISQASDVDAYGQAAWFWHLDAGVKLRKAICAATVTKKPEHREDRGVSRKAIAQGMPVVSAHLY